MGHWKAVGRGREALRKEVGHLVRPEALARKVLAPPEALVPQGAPAPPGAPVPQGAPAPQEAPAPRA